MYLAHHELENVLSVFIIVYYGWVFMMIIFTMAAGA